MKTVLSKTLNIILFVVVTWMLVERIPVVVDMFQRQGKKAPQVQMLTLTGTVVSLPLRQNHLIVFWATWCSPCKLELARINKMLSDGEISPDQVIAISSLEAPDTVKRHVEENGYLFTVGIDTSGIIARQYKVSGTPTLLLVKEDGTIDWITMGLSPSLELRLKSFLKK